MSGPLALATACIHEGMLAAEADLPSTACPYGRDRPYSRRAWIVGWTGARRRAGKPLASDRIEEQNAELDAALDSGHLEPFTRNE